MAQPELFYLYRPYREDYSKEIFLENKLWFSTPDQFNDPFEAKPRIQWKTEAYPSPTEILSSSFKHEPQLSRHERRAAVALMDKAFRRPESRAKYRHAIGSDMQRLFQSTSIGCFSLSEVNIRMWSYYASGHTGYCLGFSFEEPWTYIESETGLGFKTEPFEVNYQDEYPTVDAEFQLNNPTAKDRFIKSALLTKSKEWEGEKEWRCLRPATQSGHQFFPPSALKKVVLGAKMESKRRAAILEMTCGRRQWPDVYDAKTEDTKFRLVLKQVQL